MENKSMRFTYTITCLLLFTFLFASCGVIESVEPLSPPETAKRDKRLTGIWAAWGPGGEKDCNLEFWVQFIDGKNPLVDVHLNGLNADDTLFFKMHPTTVGEHTYMNLKPYASESYSTEQKKEFGECGYIIVKYEISDDTLRIWYLDDGSKEAIKKSQLEWDVVYDDMRITDKSENIVKFLLNTNHDKIFRDSALLTKVKAEQSDLFDVCRKNKEAEWNTENKLRSLTREAHNLSRQGMYLEATKVAEEALKFAEQKFGSDHPHVRVYVNNLAQIHDSKGEYDQVELLYKRALAITEKALGPESRINSMYLQSLNNLVKLYNSQGKYDEVELLYKRAILIAEKTFGPDYTFPDIYSESLQNLAKLYNSQGKYNEVELLYKRALIVTEQALGPDDAYRTIILNKLAEFYYSRGEYDKVEPLYSRALEIREKDLGPDHYTLDDPLRNLARFYRSQGKYEEAEPLLKRRLEILEKGTRPEFVHVMPDAVAFVLKDLADLYRIQGKYEVAEPLYKRVVEIREKSWFEGSHPWLAQSLNNLAEIYDYQGKYHEAEPVYKRALEVTEKALGPHRHRYIEKARNNLYEEAEPLYKRALEIREKTFGPDQRSVVPSLNNLARLYQTRGKYAEAEPLFTRSLEITEKNLGTDHPEVLTIIENLAKCRRDMGKLDEAENLDTRAKKLRNILDIK
jgi:tetratricopeptide (TPR) repeat protein